MSAGNQYMIRTVTDEWLRKQTTTPSTDGWYRLIVAKLNRKRSTKAYIIDGDKRWNADAVRKLLKTPVQELEQWK